MIVPSSDLILEARENGYGIGSFNVANLEMIDTVLSVAAEMQSPLIVSTSSAEARYLQPEVVEPIVATLSDHYGVTCALHLDHGDSFALAVRCLKAGYSSLMFDGSHFPIAENIALTKQVVDVAKTVGVSVEGEVGRLSGVEDDLVVDAADAHMTDVGEATRFVAETGVDLLAVAIGNAHGFYMADPKLDFTRLQEIEAATGVPIVLHGGTGIPVADVRKAIGLGIGKVNIASRIRRAYMRSVYDALVPNPNNTEVRDVMAEGKQGMRVELMASIEMLGSDGKL